VRRKLRFAVAAGIAAAALSIESAPASAADPAAGEQSFRRLCAACHIVTAEGRRTPGPSLFGVAGRRSGALDGFRFSAASRDANVEWKRDSLDAYLKNPREFMPGTTMAMPGVRGDDERANIVAYLETLR
jgi:cytochrome c